MSARFEAAGNGGTRGLEDVTVICEGFVQFRPNPQHPPPANEMAIALAEVLPKWLKENPVRVREVLPLVKDGNTITLFLWYDRAGP